MMYQIHATDLHGNKLLFCSSDPLDHMAGGWFQPRDERDKGTGLSRSEAEAVADRVMATVRDLRIVSY